MNAPVVVAFMALITFGCRFIPLALLNDPERIPLWCRRWLDYLPSAILAAAVAPTIFVPNDIFSVRPEWIAFAICLLVAVRTRKILPPVLAGLAAFWAVGFLFG